MTEVTISLPEDIAETLLVNGESLEREVLEATALEAYREGKLSQAQVRRMLGLSSDMQVDAFLKKHGVSLEYDMEDLRRETEFSLNLNRK